MAVCKVCGSNSYGEYCVKHKPKKPIKKTPLKRASKTGRKAAKKAYKRKSYRKSSKPTSLFEIAKKDMWDMFSKYVRLRDSDEDGYCTCIDGCGERFFWKYGDAGHFCGRSHMSTFIHEMNVNAQAKSCNQREEGRKWQYGHALEKKYGEGTAEYLIRLSKETKKYSIPEMKELTEFFRKKVEQLKKEKKLR